MVEVKVRFGLKRGVKHQGLGIIQVRSRSQGVGLGINGRGVGLEKLLLKLPQSGSSALAQRPA